MIFRIESLSGSREKRVFLSEKGAWTAKRALAKIGRYSMMKAVVARLRSEYPDLILERCDSA